jgi:hypothetical protein
MDERRHNARIAYTRPVELMLGDGEHLNTQSRDFSMQGIAVVTDQPLQVGESLHIKLDLKLSQRERIIKLMGQVVYTRHHGNNFVSGVKFNSLLA